MLFGDIAERIQGRSSALTLIGDYVKARAEEGFQHEADPEGRQWPPLNPAYAKRKRGPSILTESGALRKLQSRQTVNQFIIGTNSRIRYDRIHQLGGIAGFGSKIPKRTYLDATRRDREKMGKILMSHVLNTTIK